MTCGTGEICSGGTCVCGAPGYQDCGGCTNTDSDPNNCGSCGHFCSGGCVSGQCQCVSVVCGSHDCGCFATCCSNNCCAPP
jgi:hypothetical protein